MQPLLYASDTKSELLKHCNSLNEKEPQINRVAHNGFRKMQFSMKTLETLDIYIIEGEHKKEVNAIKQTS